MLRYYTRRSQGEDFIEITRPTQIEGVWAHGSKVESSDIASLSAHFKLDENIVCDIADDNELPRIEYDENHNIYFFMRIAWTGKHNTIQTMPLLAVVAGKSFVTLSKTDIFKPGVLSGKRLRSKPAGSMMLLLATVASVSESYEVFINKTASRIKEIKGRLRSREAKNSDFIQFISISDNLNTYEHNLTEMLSTAAHLLETKQVALTPRDKESLEDIILYIRQLLSSVRVSQRAVATIQSAHATISNNTLNQRMKVLTLITLMVTIPNVFYGMYGMNVALPYQNEPWAYPVVVAGTGLLMMLAFIVAKKTKLF